MDVNGDELSFNNLWTGPGMSFGSSMVILCVDNFLYALLAYYFDQVIPGHYFNFLLVFNRIKTDIFFQTDYKY